MSKARRFYRLPPRIPGVRLGGGFLPSSESVYAIVPGAAPGRSTNPSQVLPGIPTPFSFPFDEPKWQALRPGPGTEPIEDDS